MRQKLTNSAHAKDMPGHDKTGHNKSIHNKSSHNKSWLALMTFLGLAIFWLVLYFTGVIQIVAEQFSSESKSHKALITYYQWTSESGQVVISADKPSSNIDFITFEGASNLLSNQNVIDPVLVQKGQLARQEIFKREEEQASKPQNNDIAQFEKMTQSSDSLVGVLTRMSDLSNSESMGQFSAHIDTLLPAELINMSDEDKCKWLELTIEHLDDRLRQRNRAPEVEKLKSNLNKVRKEWFKQCR